jgi:ribosomal protein L6P/L9E
MQYKIEKYNEYLKITAPDNYSVKYEGNIFQIKDPDGNVKFVATGVVSLHAADGVVTIERKPKTVSVPTDKDF